MGLKAQIRMEEEELKKLGVDTGDAGMDDDDAESGTESTPPAKNSAKNDENDENDDEGNDADDEGDVAPGKKAEKTAKKADEDGEDDSGDAAPGKKDEKAAKKGEETEDDNSLAAQLRIERKQRKQMEARLAELTRPNPQQVTKTPTAPAGGPLAGDQAAPRQPTAEERLERIEQERAQTQLMGAAVEEFNNYEKEFQAETPDYAEASNHVIKTMAQSVRALYPNATDNQVGQFIRQQILHLAGSAVQKGVNPAEALYLMAHERFGYKRAPVEQPKPKTEDATKRLEQVAKNKKRSASPLAGGGQQGSASSTIEEAANMSLADFSKLKPGEIEAMIADAQG